MSHHILFAIIQFLLMMLYIFEESLDILQHKQINLGISSMKSVSTDWPFHIRASFTLFERIPKSHSDYKTRKEKLYLI